MNCMSLKKYIAKAMILALLKEKDTDGYEIALETARYTNFPKGKIYPLLLHFRKNRLISAYFRKSESGFFRKYYKITPPGRLKHLSNMTDTQHLYHMIRKILITGGMKMTRTEFMSLLQYYLKKSSAEETADIIADYNAHFDVAEDAGFSDEDIIKELGFGESLVMLILTALLAIIIIICGFFIIYTVYFRFLKILIIVPLGAIACSTMAGNRMVSHTMATYCKYFLSCVFEAVTMALAIVVCNAFINAGLPAFTGSYADWAQTLIYLCEMTFTIAMTVGSVKGAQTLTSKAFGL